MDSTTTAYRLQTFSGLFAGSQSPAPNLLRDTADERPHHFVDLGIDAQVRSGDYFITLATVLDLLGKRVDDQYIRLYLEDLVSDLIYLQDSYDITRRPR